MKSTKVHQEEEEEDYEDFVSKKETPPSNNKGTHTYMFLYVSVYIWLL